MNVIESKSSHPHTLDWVTAARPLSVLDGEDKIPLERCRNAQSSKIRQCPVAQRRVSKTYRSVAEPLLHQAVHVFLSDTVITAPHGSTSKGHFMNLGSLIQSSSKLEALPFALEAVALASLASRIWSPDVQLEAMRRYTISVQRLRKSILNSNSDVLSVIACILLLSLYEVRSL
jgi:hypothetical protein